jgi:hypothetical protein
LAVENSTTPAVKTSTGDQPVALDIHGFRVALRGWPDVVDQVRRDFAWFESTPAAASRFDIDVLAENGAPDWSAFGPLAASFVTPRNVVYQDGDRTIVDYFGQAASIFDRRLRRLIACGEDAHLVHEAMYHFVVSQASAALELRGLARLHGLGLVGDRGALAVMLPSGGGKSTLALRALQDDSVRLLSEDSPLMDRHGRLHPFPLRIGVNPGDASLLPPGETRPLRRMEFHPKLALEVKAFADRIAGSPAPARHLVIGRRTLGTEARLEPVPRLAAVGPLLREAVVGVGLYQGMEFVLQRGPWDAVGQARPGAVRAMCSAGLLRRVRTWRLSLGRDHERNWRALRPLLRQER